MRSPRVETSPGGGGTCGMIPGLPRCSAGEGSRALRSARILLLDAHRAARPQASPMEELSHSAYNQSRLWCKEAAVKRLSVAVTALALFAACTDERGPTSARPPAISAEISDAAHGLDGNPHFFWLPPMVANPASFNGPFNPRLSP